MKRIISFFLCAALLIISASSLIACDTKSEDYDKALALIDEGKYEEAKAILESLGDYKDSKDHISKFHYFPIEQSYELIDRSGVIYITIGSNNLPTKTISSNELKTVDSNYIYDTQGFLTKQFVTQSDDGGEPYTHYFDYTYDEKGNLLTAVYTDADGNVGYINSYTYDEDGNMTSESSAYSDNVPLYTMTYTYDEDGKLIKEEYTSEGYTSTSTYVFDDNGYVTEAVYTDSNEEDSHCYYTYDDKGRLIKQEYVISENEKFTYNFTYDDNGNVTKETYTHPDGTVEKVESKYVLVYVPVKLPAGTEYMIDYIFDYL